jgi:Nucleotide modification associated domain 2
MRFHSYVVRRDYGFAPNPFFRICTLATCKPVIRRVARVGDWVMGTGSKTNGREKHVVYAMRVTGTMTFEEYWADPQFRRKKPNLAGSTKQAFGDNIYSRDPASGQWRQLDSHHSLNDGSPNPVNIAADTGTNRILFSDDFVYWGGSGPQLPQRFLSWGPQHENVCAVYGHKNRFPVQMVEELVAWIRSLNETGYCGEPLDWPATQ